VLWPVYGSPMRGDLALLLYRSADSGRTWTFHEIMADARGELPVYETPSHDPAGHPLAFARTGAGARIACCARSPRDGGVTWGRLADSGITGHPPDLLKLRNGHVLLHLRLSPHAVWSPRATCSKDNGQTWGDEFILRATAATAIWATRCPSKLADGKRIFTAYYFKTTDNITTSLGPSGATGVTGPSISLFRTARPAHFDQRILRQPATWMQLRAGNGSLKNSRRPR
jgi:hypothetical protein